ncbi:hypothetical protein TNCV_4540771 [Trichonephila clavipes]|nr:hypothetical protein TNCV_4540771 [Trichonephila clavipes]
MNQTCFQNVEELYETNITRNNSFQWCFLTLSQVNWADIENYAEFLSKMPDIKINDNCLFEEERRLNVYLNSNKLEQLENQHAEKLLDRRNATRIDCHRYCSELKPRRSQHSRHRRTKDCRVRSNKSGVLAMSADTTTIRDGRCSATCVSYTSDFRWPQKKKFKQLKSGKRVGQATGVSNHSPGLCILKVVMPRDRKMCWCTIEHEPYVLVRSG